MNTDHGFLEDLATVADNSSLVFIFSYGYPPLAFVFASVRPLRTGWPRIVVGLYISADTRAE